MATINGKTNVNDTLNGLDNQGDAIFGRSGDDRIDGRGGGDALHGDEGNDVVRAGAGADKVYGDTGFDALDGGLGDDQVYGGGGNDAVQGGAGTDLVFGEAGDDLVAGGAGNDGLRGGLGDDLYRHVRSDGFDEVFEVGGTKDVLRLEGVAPADLTLSRVGFNLLATVAGGGRVIVRDHYRGGDKGIERIDFANGNGQVTASRDEATFEADAGAPAPFDSDHTVGSRAGVASAPDTDLGTVGAAPSRTPRARRTATATASGSP